MVVPRGGALRLAARSRYFKREADAERHMLGPLTEPRLLVLFVAIVRPHDLLRHARGRLSRRMRRCSACPRAGGVLLAVNALGSATGGAIYGGLHLRMSVERQFAARMGLMAVPLFAARCWSTRRRFGVARLRGRHAHRADDRLAIGARLAARALEVRDRGVHLVVDLHRERARRRHGAGRAR